MKRNPIKTLRNKADRLLQEWGREEFELCEVCGKPMNCLHHYYPKSVSSALRYEKENLIPLCQGCHLRHHSGDPRIHNTINYLRGEEWLNDLKKKKECIVKTNQKYYKEVIENI